MLQTIFANANSNREQVTNQRAEELFKSHKQEIFTNTDRLFGGLLLFQWVAGIIAALILSPRTWEGASSSVHPHVLAAIFLGAAINIFPIFLAVAHPGKPLTRYTISTAQMLMSGLLIHLSGGRIETHFHIFGSLAFLAFYRDWRVLVPATLIVCLDHLFRGIFWPQSVYGVLTASPWRTVEHGAWVIFEDIFLVISCLRSTREMRDIATQRAQLEITNQIIEEKVVQRTAEVKASEERFRLLVDGVQDYSIIMLDPQGHVASWNEGAKRVHGYEAEDILGKHVSIFHLADDRTLTPTMEEIAQAGRVEEEGWRVRPDRSTFWANVISTPLYDENGALRGFSKITRDVTLHKEAEETLQRAHDDLEDRVEQRTAELAKTNVALQAEVIGHQKAQAEIRLQNALLEAQGEAAVEGILVVSNQGEVLSYNKRLQEMWDIPQAALDSRSDQQLLKYSLPKIADSDVFLEKVTHLYNHHDERYKDEINLTDGHIFDCYSTPLKMGDDTSQGRIWFFRDITEEKETNLALQQAKAEAEQANHAKSEFLSRMSHELRTPMNAILGFAQLLELDDLNEEQEEGVAHILKAGRHLLHLINEVLEISRIEAGHLNVSLEPVCVGETLQEALSLIKPLAQQRQVLVHPFESCGCHVVADRQRLKQVFLNLFSNAIKYNRQGGSVTVECEKIPGQLFHITITDTGLGILPQDLQKLFTPFERLDAIHSTIEGTGLGLALSKRLIEAMGGEMGVKSKVGEGTTLWIDLPLVEAPLERHERIHTEAHDQHRNSGPKRTVLCIEDNLSNLRLIERVLQHQTHVTLLSAMQGSLGLELAEQHNPDLILLDLHLPDMMGDEVLRRLQATPATRHIPVVMISADATTGQIKRLRDAGASEYLTKPLDVKQFIDVLSENLQEDQPKGGSNEAAPLPS
ncbi:PAS domain S-box protein [bacterium]|nr:MAG: PAS domain S-box protein [bacterium]